MTTRRLKCTIASINEEQKWIYYSGSVWLKNYLCAFYFKSSDYIQRLFVFIIPHLSTMCIIDADVKKYRSQHYYD